MSDDFKSTKFIVFKGKKKHYAEWEAKFLARAARRGHEVILLGEEEVPADNEVLDLENETDPVKKKEMERKLKLREFNKMVFEELILSMTGDVPINLVKGAVTDKLPKGCARTAFKRLKDKFDRSSMPTLLALQNQWQNSRLKSVKMDPDEWILKMEELKEKINRISPRKLTEHDMLIQILNNLPKEYDIVIERLEDQLEDEENKLTLETLREKLCLKYERFKRKKYYGISDDDDEDSDDDEEDEEKALVATGFKGRCHNCGVYGHKSIHCKKKKGNGKGYRHHKNKNSKKGGSKKAKFNGTCNHCGKYGHKRADCWTLHPEKANAVKEEGKEEAEVVLCTAEVPKIKVQEEEEIEDETEEVTEEAMEQEGKRVPPLVAIKREEDQFPESYFSDYEEVEDDGNTDRDQISIGDDSTLSDPFLLVPSAVPSADMETATGEYMFAVVEEGSDESSDPCIEYADHSQPLLQAELHEDCWQPDPEQDNSKSNKEQEDKENRKTNNKQVKENEEPSERNNKNEKEQEELENEEQDEDEFLDIEEMSDKERDIYLKQLKVLGVLDIDVASPYCSWEPEPTERMVRIILKVRPLQIFAIAVEDAQRIWPAMMYEHYKYMKAVGYGINQSMKHWVHYDYEDGEVLRCDHCYTSGLDHFRKARYHENFLGLSAECRERGYMNKREALYEANVRKDYEDSVNRSTLGFKKRERDDNDRKPRAIKRAKTASRNTTRKEGADQATGTAPLQTQEAKPKDDREYALVNVEAANVGVEMFTPNTWIGDTGATSHMCRDATMMFDVEEEDTNVKIGDGKLAAVKQRGKLRMKVKQRNGAEKTVVLSNVLHVPKLYCNLFSITAAIKNGWTIDNKGVEITIRKESSSITFDRINYTNGGFLMGVEMTPLSNQDILKGPSNTMKEGTKVARDRVHQLLAHVNDDAVRRTANHYKWKLTGKFSACINCAIAKSKQKNLNKLKIDESKVKGYRLCLDIASFKTKTVGGAKHWLLVLDDATDMCWSFFLKKKDILPKTVIELIMDIELKAKVDVKVIRCDNAGENLSLEKECKKRGMGIKFEFTAPGTPQQNGKVERKFATLFGLTRAMLNGARLTKTKREQLKAEAANTATDTENITVTKNKPIPAYEAFWGAEALYARHLKTFGEIGIVAKHSNKKVRAKMDNRGYPCMFIGYSKNRAGDVYRMYNLSTGRIVNSRDLTWLGKSYGEYMGLKTKVKTRNKSTYKDTSETESSDDEEIIIPEEAEDTKEPQEDGSDDERDETNEDEESKSEDTSSEESEKSVGKSIPKIHLRRSERVKQQELPRAVRNLETSYNPLTELKKASGHALFCPVFDEEYALLCTMLDGAFDGVSDGVSDVFDGVSADVLSFDGAFDGEEHLLMSVDELLKEPVRFMEAWNHPVLEVRKKWRAAIIKELTDMQKRKVWRIIKKNKIPANRKLVGHKWVFKVKRNGVFRARLVAKGYTQIAGVDFKEHHSPVINDVTLRALIVWKMIKGYYAMLSDTETAFLLGDLDEDIYMELPEGLDLYDPSVNPQEDATALERPIYGLVQAARAFWKKMKGDLKKLDFEESLIDPCLMIKKAETYIIAVGFYIDDNCWFGPREEIKKVIAGLRDMGYIIKETENLHDYLSCKINFSEDGKRACITQPHLIKNLEKNFGEEVSSMPQYKTPGTPSFKVFRNKEEAEKISKEQQSRYRTGVGMLLYLVKHSRPDIANSVRELSKVLDGASEGDYKEMKRVIKYVLDSATYGLRIEPRLKEDAWTLTVYSDSDFAGDKEQRISVSGYILYLCGVPISWKSKGQKSVALSSTEAEYVAMSEAVKEIRFVAQLMEALGTKIQYPMIVRVDNVGAIYIAENQGMSNRTRHVDIRAHYVKEFIEDGVVKIKFVRSGDNTSDMMTKNLNSELHGKHSSNVMVDDKEMKEVIQEGDKTGRMLEDSVLPPHESSNEVLGENKSGEKD